jgi:hypothetical protein
LPQLLAAFVNLLAAQSGLAIYGETDIQLLKKAARARATSSERGLAQARVAGHNVLFKPCRGDSDRLFRRFIARGQGGLTLFQFRITNGKKTLNTARYSAESPVVVSLLMLGMVPNCAEVLVVRIP